MMRQSLAPGWAYAGFVRVHDRVRDGMPPLIICCACNGGVQGKEYNENIPETPDEIAASVHAAYNAGAAMVHVHARNPDDLPKPATQVANWQEVNAKIRERCPNIIVNNTTGAGFGVSMEERLSCLGAYPDMASLNLTPDMSRFVLKERRPPLPHPRPGVEIDECCTVFVQADS